MIMMSVFPVLFHSVLEVSCRLLADIDECLSSPCLNGVCSQGVPGTFICTCNRGYAGLTCESDINECLALSPCQNEGTCRQGPPGTYSCSCMPGFTGTRWTQQFSQLCFGQGILDLYAV
jgi:hypothetical protein